MIDWAVAMRRMAAFWLVAGALCAPAPGHATPITSYVNIQPIDVCSTPTTCAPMTRTGATTPIGFTDFTRKILNEMGIDPTFNPVSQYVNSTFFQLHVTTASDGTLTSNDFKALSGRTTPPAGDPLSSNPTTINMFFVDKIVPPTTGVLYGFSWINNNGVAIAKSTYLPPFGTPPRTDTLAHEIGHNLGLDHTTFGAGSANNALSAGDVRQIASTLSAIPTTGTLDALLAAQQTTAQQSPMINPIPLVTTSVTSTPTTTAALQVASFTSTSSEGGSSGDPTFNIHFQGGGRPDEFLKTFTVALPAGTNLAFQSSEGSFPAGFQITSITGLNPGDVQARIVDGKLVLTFADGAFTDEADLDFSVRVNQCESSDALSTFSESYCSPVGAGALAGATIAYQFSDGFVTTSELLGAAPPSDALSFGPTSFFLPVTELTADSWDPVFGIPSFIVDPTNFIGFKTILPDGPLVLADADPRFEGDQGPAAIPEPPTILLLLLGLASLALFRLGGRRARA